MLAKLVFPDGSSKLVPIALYEYDTLNDLSYDDPEYRRLMSIISQRTAATIPEYLVPGRLNGES